MGRRGCWARVLAEEHSESQVAPSERWPSSWEATILNRLCAAVVRIPRLLSDSSWKLLAERAMVVVQQDGSESSGKLLGVDGTTVTLMAANGQRLSLPRSSIQAVREQPPAGSPPAAPRRPLRPADRCAPPTAAPPPERRLSNERDRGWPPLLPPQLTRCRALGR